MKTKQILICCLMLTLAANLYAGSNNKDKKHHSGAKTTLADPGEGDYDIKHLKFDLHVTDTSVYVWGNVTTTAQVIASSMSNYIFELDTLMIIDSAKVNGALQTVTHVGFIRTITLPSALPNGSMFSAQIFYHGVPPAGGGFFNGLTHAVSAHGTQMLYTISDPWVAQDWWPAKQSVNDKIDSVDMFVTVPSGVVDGSNGLLVNVDSTSVPGYWKYHWQTHYPINYYLISIAVARYADYRSYWHFTGSTDSMLIQNFLMDTATFNPLYKSGFDSMGQFIDYFSTLYGRYPFWQEKFGASYTNLPGGMEHQTLITIGVPNTYVIAHELTHQWFGDDASYQSWHETWLSEAFATYTEQLFFTHFWSAAAGKAHRQSLLNSALGRPCGMVYVNDTTNADSLFDQPTVYNKGQAVLNMLRYIAPTDSQFFQVLKTYHQNFSGSNASTADFQNIAEATYGTSLGIFFNQWIYGRGYPMYKISWDQVGSTVFVKLIQTPSCPSYTSFFYTPVELQLHSATADTIVKVYNSSDTQVYTFDWTPAMSTVYLNPDVWTICKLLGTVTQDTSLRVGAVIQHNIKIFPNPSKNYWQIDRLTDNTSLTLTDINGHILWQGISNKGSATIPGERLAAGDYLLKVNGINISESIKLVHW
ncbi:MAG: M1 family aminopeptidase [Chitinophagales bacterium]